MADVADKFVRVRLIRITGADLNLFEFDYDTTWAAFFMNADERIYGRYGGRDAASADGRMSLAGLKFAMQTALDAHEAGGNAKPQRTSKSIRVEDYPASRNHRGCIHCHEVYEFRRSQMKSLGKWTKDEVWTYPWPENVGITLEVDRGNRVKSIVPDSAAAKAGLRPGDNVKSINGISVASFADAQYGLHKAPASGTIEVSWSRSDQPMSGVLDLKDGWRRTNITWRPSLLNIMASLSLSGDDLTGEEKKALGLGAKQLAFRQEQRVHRDARAAGVQAGDIIVGVEGQKFDMTMLEFFGHIRKNYFTGEKLTLNVIRAGKRVDLPMTLK